MQSQRIRCLTGDEIRRGDRQAQDEASHAYHVRQLEVMVNKFDQIVKAAKAGEAVTVFDQWGDSVTLAAVKDSESDS